MKHNTKVITPHLSIYKIQVNSLISIIFRLTSILLTILFLVIFLFEFVFIDCGFFLIFKDTFVSFFYISLTGIWVTTVIFHLSAGYLHIMRS